MKQKKEPQAEVRKVLWLVVVAALDRACYAMHRRENALYNTCIQLYYNLPVKKHKRELTKQDFFC